MVRRMVTRHDGFRLTCRLQRGIFLLGRFSHCMVSKHKSFHPVSIDSTNAFDFYRAIIGPYIVSQGVAFGEAVHSDTHSDWNGLMSYISMSDDFTSAEHPSARYWLLWPGVACMLAVAFTGKVNHPNSVLNRTTVSFSKCTNSKPYQNSSANTVYSGY